MGGDDDNNTGGNQGQECLAAGTEIAMANGSVKKIEDICEGDMILSFDHESGCFVGNPVLYLYRGEELKRAFTLRFANGKTLSIIGEHDLFEQESLKYVTITEEDAEQFIGKHFYCADEHGYVELIDATRESEAVDYYEIYVAKTLNMVANGMLNVGDDVDHVLNIYEFNADLSISKEALLQDIHRYGLLAYTGKFGLSKQEYDGFNLRYLNIVVGKGLISRDDLFKQRSDYLIKRNDKGTSQCA